MGTVTSRAKLAEFKQSTQRFDAHELRVLKETFKDLAERSPGKTVDKDTFLQFFPLPGMMGERLFSVFDRKGTGKIDFEEFLVGVAVGCRGTVAEKTQFIFNLYDLTGDNAVSKQELTTMLSHVPASVLGLDPSEAHVGVQSLADRAFQDCDLNQNGKLSANQFQLFLDRTPELAQFVDLMLPYDTSTLIPGSPHKWAQAEGEGAAHGARPGEVMLSGPAAGAARLSSDWVRRGEGTQLSLLSRFKREEASLPIRLRHSASATAHLSSDESAVVGEPSRESGSHAVSASGHRRPQTATHCKEGGSRGPSLPSPRSHGTLGPDGTSDGLASRPESALSESPHGSPPAAVGDDAGMPLPAHPSPAHCRSPLAAASPHGMEPLGRGLARRSGGAPSAAAGSAPSGATSPAHSGFASTDGGVSRASSSSSVTHGGAPRLQGGETRVDTPQSLGQGGRGDVLIRSWTLQCAACGTYRKFCVACGVRHTPDVDAQFDSSRGAWRITCEHCGVATDVAHCESCGARRAPEDAHVQLERRRRLFEMEGLLWKRGRHLSGWARRWYYLRNNVLYYYGKTTDEVPRGVIFLDGCTVDPLDDEHRYKDYFGLQIVPARAGGERDRRALYARSRPDRNNWVSALRTATLQQPLKDAYKIGRELGTGKFSRVCEAVHNTTGEKMAVKIINKDSMQAEEKDLMRTEIAVLKLVRHQNNIYIVTELLHGGELFDRIVGRARFGEDEARAVMRPLLSSVAYLHQMGIVHRDLKPENILCGEELSDLKIADFGLSKMVVPEEMMKMPCGTLTYVAPEVLSMRGYGREADLWSVGCIMHLLLRGTLPFDGDNRDLIIRRTIHGEVDLQDRVWSRLSREARSLAAALLEKDPRKRITADEALQHPWMIAGEGEGEGEGESAAQPVPSTEGAKGAQPQSAPGLVGARPASGAAGDVESTPIPLPLSVEADTMDPDSAWNRSASTAAAMAAVTAEETVAGAEGGKARKE